MQVIATKSIHTIIKELMNLLHGNKFLLGRLTLLVLMSSVLTNYVSVHVCILVQVLVKAHEWNDEVEYVLLLGSINVSLTLYF